MNKKEQILSILKKNKSQLYSKYPIRSMALFGSIAREEDSESSDIDIMIDVNGEIGIRFVDLADEIESLLNHDVDLVSKNAIKPKYFKVIKNDLIYV